MDSQVSHAYSLSSITLFLHRGQYNSTPAARHLSWTRHSFFRHPGHSAQPPLILAFSVLYSIFPSLFESLFQNSILVYALYIALYLSGETAPVFPGGQVRDPYHNLAAWPERPPPHRRRRIAQAPRLRAASCIIWINMHPNCRNLRLN